MTLLAMLVFAVALVYAPCDAADFGCAQQYALAEMQLPGLPARAGEVLGLVGSLPRTLASQHCLLLE